MTIIQFSSAVRRIQPAYALARTTHAPNLTVAIPDWRDARSADGCRPRGVSTYVDKFEQFVVFAGDIPSNQITADLVESYKLHLHKRGLESSTVRHASADPSSQPPSARRSSVGSDSSDFISSRSFMAQLPLRRTIFGRNAPYRRSYHTLPAEQLHARPG